MANSVDLDQTAPSDLGLHCVSGCPDLSVHKLKLGLYLDRYTVKIHTPKTFAVITLKFEQDGFTVE